MRRDWEILHGDCLDVLRGMEADSVDAVVTDPPYGLGFMGKAWDALPPGEELGKLLLHVLKPGSHLVAFGGTRTYHRLACALEDAGFEIRDSLAWLYGSGFPKSLNLDGDWEGWGTALKPAFEPIVLARKPLAVTVAGNVAEHGTGALNVDGCRVDTDPADRELQTTRSGASIQGMYPSYGSFNGEWKAPSGRWPPNVLLGHAECCGEECGPCCPVRELDRQSGESISTQANQSAGFRSDAPIYGDGRPVPRLSGANDRGGASRFFPRFRYVAKASTSERNAGLEGTNVHPTVKPTDLMAWLCRLVTPPGGLILDPFLGSGTTMVAALREGFRCIGIEKEAEYVKIATRRVEEDMPLFRRVR